MARFCVWQPVAPILSKFIVSRINVFDLLWVSSTTSRPLQPYVQNPVSNLFTDTFMGRTWHDRSRRFIINVPLIINRWTFAQKKLPLICKRTIHLLKLQEFTNNFSSYPLSSHPKLQIPKILNTKSSSL